MATAIDPAKVPQEESTKGGRSPDSITHCYRCGGLMVMEQLIDLPGHRCVQCGECIDPVILQNRLRSLPISLS